MEIDGNRIRTAALKTKNDRKKQETALFGATKRILAQSRKTCVIYMKHNYLSTLFTLAHPNETQQLCKMQMQKNMRGALEIRQQQYR